MKSTRIELSKVCSLAHDFGSVLGLVQYMLGLEESGVCRVGSLLRKETDR